MAAKRPNPREDPPAPSSSDEEEENSSTEADDDDGSTSEEKQPPQARPVKPSAAQPLSQSRPPRKPDSSSANPKTESETESEPDSDDSDTESDSPANVAASASPSSSKSSKLTSKAPLASPAPSRSSAAAGKRGNETALDSKDAKRRKEAEGKLPFQKLWREVDEIAVLNGIIELYEKRRVDPTRGMAALCGYMKKSLSFDVSLAQLKDKVSRLRKKFENNVKGMRGEDKQFAILHDQKAFDLSKKIWGSKGFSPVSAFSAMSNGTAKSGRSNSKLLALKAELGLGNDNGRDEVSSLNWMGDFEALENHVVKKGLEMVRGLKRAELMQRWKDLNAASLEVFIKRNRLIADQAQSIVEALEAERTGG